MDNPDCLDATGDRLMPSTSDIEGGNARESDSASSVKSFLNEIDSYLDDINTRLTVSRMVSNSLIKGMVSAVAEEAAERLTLKEAEIAFLNEKLQHHESGAAKDSRLDSLVAMPKAQNTKSMHHCTLRVSGDHKHSPHFGRLRIAAEEQLQMIKDETKYLKINVCSVDAKKLHVIDECTDALQGIISATYEQIDDMVRPSKASVTKQQGEREIQNLIKGVQDDLEAKFSEQRDLIASVNKKWQEKTGELSTTRQELDAISRCLFSLEPGLLVSHNSLESLEEGNTAKRKDQFASKVPGNRHLPCASHAEENSIIKSEESAKAMLTDSPQLKCMGKEELITYFKTEMTKMKRSHDSALQEKTEELFTLKREFFKEKGSSPLHFRKEKEFELLMRKIPELMSKLDEILLDNENLLIIDNDQSILYSLKDRIDTLFFENQRLQVLLNDKTKEARCFASQVSDADSQILHYSSMEAKYVEQIKKLQSDVEDVKIDTTIRAEINKIILRELVGEFISDMEGLELVVNTEQDIYCMIYEGVVSDVLSSINPIIVTFSEEINSVAARLLEKEKTITSEIKENMRLKQEIESLLAIVKEKEEFASEVGSRLIQQNVRYNLVCQELNRLTDRVNELEMSISESKRESDLMRDRRDKALQQIRQYEFERSKVNQELRTVSDALEESEKQKLILQRDVQEKQKAIASAIAKEREQKKLMEAIANSMTELSQAIEDCECKQIDDIKTKESRLKLMNHQCVQLVKHANLLEKELLLYKERFERRCSDLQKAENEVDLLADQVDALLSLLEKIYVALDHYSPVLQHYTGVVEILKLIRQEMKGDLTKLV